MFSKLVVISLAIVVLARGARIPFKSEFMGVSADRYVDKEPYIVGGDLVEGRQFPSIVSLLVDNNQHCGASILTSEWILTAAHCNWYTPDKYVALVGSNSIIEGGQRYTVVEARSHENFSEKTAINDIAVMKVSPPIALGDGVEVAKLPKMGQETPDGSQATVVGWGDTTEGGSPSKDLRKADVIISDQGMCNQTYNFEIEHTHICAGWYEDGRGSCSGDSGGPLYVDNEVVGIVSWGYSCSLKKYPTVYTRVAEYIDWIEKNIRG